MNTRIRLICLALVIAHVSPGLSSIIPTYRRAYFREPIQDDANVPQRWKIVASKSSPAEIEIRVLKGHIVSEDRDFNTEYRYSSGNYKDRAMDSYIREPQVEPRGGERQVEEVQAPEDNVLFPEKVIPQIGSRNIVTAPSFCPKGQRKDRQGRCKPIVS